MNLNFRQHLRHSTDSYRGLLSGNLWELSVHFHKLLGRQGKGTVAVFTGDEPQKPLDKPEETETVYKLKLEFYVTRVQANALKAFLEDNNINYTKI